MQRANRKTVNRRLLITGAASMLGVAGLGVHLFRIQTHQIGHYRDIARDHHVRLHQAAANRALITDRHGIILADNLMRYQLVIELSTLNNLDGLIRILHKVRAVPGFHELDLNALTEQARRQSRFSDLIVLHNLNRQQLERLQVRLDQFKGGVTIKTVWQRHWPLGDAASHILGYVSRQSPNGERALPGQLFGQAGLEKALDPRLQGMPGQKQVEVMASGRPVRVLSEIPSQSRPPIATTLDARLQLLAARQLEPHQGGAVVLMDLKTAHVLAMTSKPGFDPNQLVIPIDDRHWQELLRDQAKPLINRASHGLYAPGSTFKPVSALAALAKGVPASFTVTCRGHLDVGDSRFHCWKKHGHGRVNMEQAIAQSCDVWFYEAARRTGIAAISDLAHRCGFGGMRGELQLPAGRSIVPDQAWKRQQIQQPWYLGDTIVAAIGQGYVTVTPLDLCVMIARIASGNFALEPCLVPVPDSDKAGLAQPRLEQGFAAHLDYVRAGMREAVIGDRGTARGLASQDPAFQIAGKTGSAQVRRITQSERLIGLVPQQDLAWHLRDHALFVGYAPADRPRFAVSVLIEHGISGARSAGPVARAMLLAAQNQWAEADLDLTERSLRRLEQNQ